MKKSKIRFFQKWSPESKIRNGEALRLCLDCLPRLWRPSRLEIGNAPSLSLSPWKPLFLQPFKATRASELIFKPQNRFLKMSFKWSHTFKYGFWWLFGCPRVIGITFPSTYKLWEPFGEKNNFRIFLKQFLLHFSLKMKQKWRWKNRKCNFFKNEALNWKSATVKVLGYMLTVSDDCEDPPTMKLAMPLASNSPHEIHGF